MNRSGLSKFFKKLSKTLQICSFGPNIGFALFLIWNFMTRLSCWVPKYQNYWTHWVEQIFAEMVSRLNAPFRSNLEKKKEISKFKILKSPQNLVVHVVVLGKGIWRSSWGFRRQICWSQRQHQERAEPNAIMSQSIIKNYKKTPYSST